VNRAYILTIMVTQITRTIRLGLQMISYLFQKYSTTISLTICCGMIILTGCEDSVSSKHSRPVQSQNSSADSNSPVYDKSETLVTINRDASDQLTADHTLCTSPWDWPFVPVSFRIHPLTRFTETVSDNKSVIESRIEFFDSQGHNTKGLGTIRFELYARDDLRSGSTQVGRIAMWEPSISTIEANSLHYDDITRTYLFLLEIDRDISLPPTGILMCTVIMNRARRIQGQTEIRLR